MAYLLFLYLVWGELVCLCFLAVLCLNNDFSVNILKDPNRLNKCASLSRIKKTPVFLNYDYSSGPKSVCDHGNTINNENGEVDPS